MPSASSSIVIHRPVDEVFAFFTTPANDPQWRTHVQSISAEGPPAVGSRISQKISGPGGRPIAADIELTAYDPPSLYAFQVVAGPVRPKGEYRFTPEGADTRVDFSLSADLSGFKKLMMGGQVQKSMDSEVAGLTRAKSILESA